MSDIKVGDLVMVVRGHSCIVEAFGGIPLRVKAINPPPDTEYWRCSRCNGHRLAKITAYVPFRHAALPLPWLKKIDPLSELDDVKQDEEITA